MDKGVLEPLEPLRPLAPLGTLEPLGSLQPQNPLEPLEPRKAPRMRRREGSGAEAVAEGERPPSFKPSNPPVLAPQVQNARRPETSKRKC